MTMKKGNPLRNLLMGGHWRFLTAGVFVLFLLIGVYAKRQSLQSVFFPNRIAGMEMARHEEGPSDDPRVRIGDIEGPKIVVVWTLGCMPCLKTLLLLNKLDYKLKERGVSVVPLLVSADQRQSQIFWGITVVYFSRYVKPGATWKTIFPLLTPYYDVEGQIYDYIDVTSVPTILFMNSKNQIVQKMNGFQDWSAEEGSKALDNLHDKITE